jgi:probable rRNA maturation factor
VADARLARAIAAALEASGAPRPGSVTLVLSDDAELAELNAEHMGHQGPTDVLSFPMLPPDAFPAAPAKAAGARTETGARPARTHIGDIAVSLERAAEQAEAGRGGQTGNVHWSAADELRLLVTHGTLHLGGRDHADPGEEAAMRALERALLERTRS